MHRTPGGKRWKKEFALTADMYLHSSLTTKETDYNFCTEITLLESQSQDWENWLSTKLFEVCGTEPKTGFQSCKLSVILPEWQIWNGRAAARLLTTGEDVVPQSAERRFCQRVSLVLDRFNQTPLPFIYTHIQLKTDVQHVVGYSQLYSMLTIY